MLKAEMPIGLMLVGSEEDGNLAMTLYASLHTL